MEELGGYLNECGFEVLENNYVSRQTINVKEGINAQRIFVQTKCRKPFKADHGKDALLTIWIIRLKIFIFSYLVRVYELNFIMLLIICITNKRECHYLGRAYVVLCLRAGF